MLPASAPLHTLRVKRSTFGFDEGILFYRKGLYLHVPHQGSQLLDEQEAWKNFAWHDYPDQIETIERYWQQLITEGKKYSAHAFTLPTTLEQRYMRVCPDDDTVGFFLPGERLLSAHHSLAWKEHFPSMGQLLEKVFSSEKALDGLNLNSVPAQVVVKAELLKDQSAVSGNQLTGVVIDKIIQSSVTSVQDDHHLQGEPKLLSSEDTHKLMRLAKSHVRTGMHLNAFWRTPQANWIARIWWRPALPHELEQNIIDLVWS